MDLKCSGLFTAFWSVVFQHTHRKIHASLNKDKKVLRKCCDRKFINMLTPNYVLKDMKYSLTPVVITQTQKYLFEIRGYRAKRFLTIVCLGLFSFVERSL